MKESENPFSSMDIKTILSNDEGILTGGGGGFTMVYTDFAIESQGETIVHNYTIDMSTGEPTDMQSARLLLRNRRNEFEEFT